MRAAIGLNVILRVNNVGVGSLRRIVGENSGP